MAAVDGQHSEFTTAVLSSTTILWGAAFAARGRIYTAPRVIRIDLPRHHPSRGFGYAPGAGVFVDMREVADIRTLFGPDSEGLIALMIAHEVAHHVQLLNQIYRHQPPAEVSVREREADCAAGWWLGRANATHINVTGTPLYRVPGIEHQLPRLFQALDMLGNGMAGIREQQLDDAHGFTSARVKAFQQGLITLQASDCGVGLAP